MRKRTIAILAILLAICLAGIFAYLYFDSPRRVLLADVKSASSIIVTWHRKENGETVRHAYRLDVDSRDPFVRKLRDDLSVDYLRGQATVTPTIGLYLTNDDETLLAYYAIRYARGGGTSLSMKTLRQIAMSGIELTDDEISGIFTDDLRSKWPHPFGFDYTLPVTQNEN